jgi:hypothetical protein
MAKERPDIPSRPIVPQARPKVETIPKVATTAPDQSKMREWKDKTGKFTVEAAYVGIADNKVQLHKLNGVVIGVPLDKLDDSTLQYLRTLPGNGNLNVGVKPNIPAPPQVKQSSFNSLAVKNSSGENYTYNGFDWNEWLMKAGIASSDAASYAEKFVNQRLDSTILSDIDRDALRSMGITEGDIIRIRKAANLPTMTQASRTKANQNEASAHARNMDMLSGKYRDSQMVSDEAYARQLQKEELGRTSTGGRGSNFVDPSALFEAGNLLKQANSGGVPRMNTAMGASKFVKPPSTAEAASSLGLGNSSGFSNDPWGSSMTMPQSQEAIYKAKLQQEETQRALDTAKSAILKANEQARQANIIEEQAKVAKLKQQSDMALLQAQETAKHAMLIQQQAAQKLMAAQMGASNPMMQQGFSGTSAYMQPQQFAARPLANPLIPTPHGVSGGFVPTGNIQQRPQYNQPQQFNQSQQSVQTLVTPGGVEKPNWNNASTSIYLTFSPKPTICCCRITRSLFSI